MKKEHRNDSVFTEESLNLWDFSIRLVVNQATNYNEPVFILSCYDKDTEKRINLVLGPVFDMQKFVAQMENGLKDFVAFYEKHGWPTAAKRGETPKEGQLRISEEPLEEDFN